VFENREVDFLALQDVAIELQSLRGTYRADVRNATLRPLTVELDDSYTTVLTHELHHAIRHCGKGGKWQQIKRRGDKVPCARCIEEELLAWTCGNNFKADTPEGMMKLLHGVVNGSCGSDKKSQENIEAEFQEQKKKGEDPTKCATVPGVKPGFDLIRPQRCSAPTRIKMLTTEKFLTQLQAYVKKHFGKGRKSKICNQYIGKRCMPKDIPKLDFKL